jgi:23S rRNA (cytidine1920-2'-O)/16S rRNA (cytidine1409-2'-O)-methyltransferase
MNAPRQRVDRLLVERGIFESRAKAQAAIEAGLVTANEIVVSKVSEEIPTNASLRARAAHPYVSRGGVKLAAALDHLLDRGARRVYAVDVGRGQLHETLRNRPEVISLEATDIRSLSPALLDESPDIITIDVSFISLKLVLPSATALAKTPAQLIALIKPQFEVGAGRAKKGIVRDPVIHSAVCDDVAKFVASLGWRVLDVVPSPIEGGDGNVEFLLGAARD